MVTDPESGEVILLGGSDQGTGSREVLRLGHVHGQWEKIAELKQPRANHVSFFVHDEDVSEC